MHAKSHGLESLFSSFHLSALSLLSPIAAFLPPTPSLPPSLPSLSLCPSLSPPSQDDVSENREDGDEGETVELGELFGPGMGVAPMAKRSRFTNGAIDLTDGEL